MMLRKVGIGVVAFTALLAALVAAGGKARAQTTQIKIIQEIPPATETPEQKKAREKKGDPAPLPTVRALVKSDLPNLKKEDFKLKLQEERDTPVEPTAVVAVPFKDSNEDMAVVILVQGNERFMGNMSTIDPDGQPRDPSPGAYEDVKAGIDILKNVGPKKTRGAILTYGGQVMPKAPMGPISGLSGEAIGAAKEYHEVGTKKFKDGLEAAFDLLSKEPGRKVLIVIGDGGDINANVAIVDTVGKLRNLDAELYCIRATAKRDDFDNSQNQQRMKQLCGAGVKVAAKTSDIQDASQQIVNDIQSLYSVDFPSDQLPQDGKDHPYIVLAKKGESNEVEFTCKGCFKDSKVVEEKKDEGGGSTWWIWLLVGLGAVGLIVVGVILFGKKPQQQMQEFAPPPPGPQMPAAAPPGPQKTMMFNMGGGGGGMPIVGWIVPLTGPQQFQTFKLQQGKTLIGTAPDCNVVVADPFMSTHHCEIAMAPDGFKLIDRGSTNGMLVNSKRVPTHDLVDNDMFTLGKTEFKFKSIL
jgi:hypothetical protein